MKHLKKQLISIAFARYGQIHPCSSAASLEECFSVDLNMLLFWYNTPDGSTHMERMVLPARRERREAALADA